MSPLQHPRSHNTAERTSPPHPTDSRDYSSHSRRFRTISATTVTFLSLYALRTIRVNPRPGALNVPFCVTRDSTERSQSGYFQRLRAKLKKSSTMLLCSTLSSLFNSTRPRNPTRGRTLPFPWTTLSLTPASTSATASL